MITHVSFELKDECGVPTARIPAAHSWSLVEYLGFQRIHASYSFHLDRLVVRFHNMDFHAAEAMVSEWALHETPLPEEKPQSSHLHPWMTGIRK